MWASVVLAYVLICWMLWLMGVESWGLAAVPATILYVAIDYDGK